MKTPTLLYVVISLGVTLLIFFGVVSPKRQVGLLRVSSEIVDFGTISVLDSVTSPITLFNDSSKSVSFKVKVDCNCTQVEPDSGTIDPFGNVAVAVTFKPKGLADKSIGNENSALSVITGSALDTIHVMLKARILKPVLVDSAKLICDVNALDVTPFSLELLLRDDVLSIESLDIPGYLSNFSISNVTSVGDSFRAVRLRGDLSGGVTLGRQDIKLVFEVVLRLDRSGSFAKERFVLPVQLHVLPPYTCTPDFLTVGFDQIATVCFVPKGHLKSLEIISARSTPGSIECSFSDASASIKNQMLHGEVIGSIDFKVRCQSTSSEFGEFSQRLTVVNDGKEVGLSLP